jgi:hypothetical protein
LDASTIYGSTTGRAEELRAFTGGKLRTTKVPQQNDLLPQAAADTTACNSVNEQSCFRSGSDQVREKA